MKTPAVVVALLIAHFPLSAHASSSQSQDQVAGTGRSLRLAATYQELTNQPFGSISRSAPGLTGVYEFQLSENFALGISLAYRRYAGAKDLSQLGYGVIMRHSIGFLRSGSLRPYVAYGLLAQTSSLGGSSGSGTSHDTRLTTGTDFRIGRIPLFFELSYHLSRLKFLNVDSLNLDYWESTIGWQASI